MKKLLLATVISAASFSALAADLTVDTDFVPRQEVKGVDLSSATSDALDSVTAPVANAMQGVTTVTVDASHAYSGVTQGSLSASKGKVTVTLEKTDDASDNQTEGSVHYVMNDKVTLGVYARNTDNRVRTEAVVDLEHNFDTRVRINKSSDDDLNADVLVGYTMDLGVDKLTFRATLEGQNMGNNMDLEATSNFGYTLEDNINVTYQYAVMVGHGINLERQRHTVEVSKQIDNFKPYAGIRIEDLQSKSIDNQFRIGTTYTF